MLIGEALVGGTTGDGMAGRLSGSSRPSLLKKLLMGGGAHPVDLEVGRLDLPWLAVQILECCAVAL